MEFESIGTYLTKCNSTQADVVVPDMLTGIYADAFKSNRNVTNLVLPENIKYCVSLDSCLVSQSIETITIYNSWFSGGINTNTLPDLRKVVVLDEDPQRLSSIRTSKLVSQLADLPERVEVYFPYCNLYACDRKLFLDIKLCIRYLHSKHLYDERAQQRYDEYIKLHASGILHYLVENGEIDIIRSFIPTVDPSVISQALPMLQEMGDTEIVATALDTIGQSTKSSGSSTAFDLGFLDDILAETEPAGDAHTGVFTSTNREPCEFEVRGIEGNCVVVGAYLGEACRCFIVPERLKGLAVEGIGIPQQQPTASPIAIAVSAGIHALFRHSLVCYSGLRMLLLTQDISFIDITAIPESKTDSLVIYCPSGSYAETWATDHGFTVKSPALFIQDLKNQGV